MAVRPSSRLRAMTGKKDLRYKCKTKVRVKFQEVATTVGLRGCVSIVGL
jgi:hypothetical protein